MKTLFCYYCDVFPIIMLAKFENSDDKALNAGKIAESMAWTISATCVSSR